MGRPLGKFLPESVPELLPGSPALDDLVTNTGESWATFRATLVPRYATAWAEVAACYLMIIAGVVVCVWAARRGQLIALAFAPFAAIWLGYWLSSLISFMHEAAHFNMH